jgi:hypothetical protein
MVSNFDELKDLLILIDNKKVDKEWKVVNIIQNILEYKE